MPRRVSLPAADDLFAPRPVAPVAPVSRVPAGPRAVPEEPPAADDVRRPSGRVRHEEKMTVYVTAEELLDLEQARLTLRRDLGVAVDRGRIVREAVAMALADLEEHGTGSALVERLARG